VSKQKQKIVVEVPEGVSVVYLGKRRIKDRRDFVKVYGEALEWIAININSITSRKVLDILIANVEYDGCIRITMPEIGKKLGIAKPNIHKAIGELKALNIVKIKKEGKHNVYEINSDIAWKNDEESKNDNKKKFNVIDGGKKDINE
jgi:uncharacterized membrane protein